MKSANLKLPEQHVVGVGSSPQNLGAPSNCFGFGIGSNNIIHHDLSISSSSSTSSSSSSSTTPPFSSCSSSVGNSNNNNNPSYDIGMVSNSSSASTITRHNNYKSCDDNIINNSIMVHDLGSIPSWDTSSYDMQLAKIKEEISESFPKFTELLLNGPSNSNIDDYGHFLLASHLKNSTTKDHFGCSLSTSSSGQIDGCDQIPGPDFGGHYSSTSTRGQFSQIYPSVNISSLSYQNYSSGRFMGSVMSQPGLNDNINSSLGGFASNYNFGLVDDQIPQPHDRLSCGRTASQRISSLNSEMAKLEKRSMEPMRTSSQLAAPNKKSRSESKTPSCPPFKVRKEKLGDRIAALQQLVSPFGKTDTASVLMETIGYIKFLQHQVETLSVPYMKSSRNKSTKTMQAGLKEDGSEEAKRDLRSKGLCLVPLSCMSYVTGDHGGGSSIWPPPSFGGRT